MGKIGEEKKDYNPRSCFGNTWLFRKHMVNIGQNITHEEWSFAEVSARELVHIAKTLVNDCGIDEDLLETAKDIEGHVSGRRASKVYLSIGKIHKLARSYLK